VVSTATGYKDVNMSSHNNNELIIRQLGQQDYQTAWSHMRELTDQRTADSVDELWLLEHPPVFTLGQAGKMEHVLAPGIIPLVQTDRGGQVTYHGPGQLVVYFLIDLRRKPWGVRCLVSLIEQSVITLLQHYQINAQIKVGAPGVYVGDEKIASIGLRVRRGCTYHGLSLNIAMDLEPFSQINPCGFQGLQITQLSHFVPNINMDEVQRLLTRIINEALQNKSVSCNKESAS